MRFDRRRNELLVPTGEISRPRYRVPERLAGRRDYLSVNELTGFGGGDATPPKVITFLGSSANAADQTTYSYASCDFGDEAVDRYILFAAGCSNTARTISSSSAGGVAARTIITQSNAAATCSVAFMIASVPTGTDGTLGITWSAGCNRSAIAWWSITGLLSDTEVDALGDAAGSPMSVMLDTVDGGVAAGYGWENNGTIGAWAGLTSRFATLNFESTVDHAGADVSPTTAPTLGVTLAHSGSAGVRAMAAVSF